MYQGRTAGCRQVVPQSPIQPRRRPAGWEAGHGNRRRPDSSNALLASTLDRQAPGRLLARTPPRTASKLQDPRRRRRANEVRGGICSAQRPSLTRTGPRAPVLGAAGPGRARGNAKEALAAGVLFTGRGRLAPHLASRARTTGRANGPRCLELIAPAARPYRAGRAGGEAMLVTKRLSFARSECEAEWRRWRRGL